MTRRSNLEATALTGSEPTIRVYRDSDEDQVVALWHACGLTKDYNPPAGDIAFCRATPTAELFVAEDDGRVVATAMTGHDGHRGWLYYVAVEPALRGTGLGRLMVARAEAWLAALGVRKVNLIIRDTNTAVRGFYERLGYDVEPRTQMARWLVEKPAANDSG
jgi:ribosomal protein S18 acetylase RimI-like enzyme